MNQKETIKIEMWDKNDQTRYDGLLKGLNQYIQEQIDRGITPDIAIGIYKRKKGKTIYKQI